MRQRTNEHFGRHRAGADPVRLTASAPDRRRSTAGSSASRRARLQHAGQHDEAVDADHAGRRRSALPQHAARHRHRHRTATAQRHHATCVVRSRREGRARRDTGGSDAGTGCCSNSGTQFPLPPRQSPCRMRRPRPPTVRLHPSRVRWRLPLRRPHWPPSPGLPHQPKPLPRPHVRPHPAPVVRPATASRQAPAAKPAPAANAARRVRSRQQDPRNPCQQADGADRAAQARARRDRSALPEDPRLQAALGRGRRTVRARQRRARISARHRRRRSRSERLSDAEPCGRQRGSAGRGRAQVHRDAADLRAARFDRPRALQPRQPEHRVQACVRRRRRAEQDRRVQRSAEDAGDVQSAAAGLPRAERQARRASQRAAGQCACHRSRPGRRSNTPATARPAAR